MISYSYARKQISESALNRALPKRIMYKNCRPYSPSVTNSKRSSGQRDRNSAHISWTQTNHIISVDVAEFSQIYFLKTGCATILPPLIRTGNQSERGKHFLLQYTCGATPSHFFLHIYGFMHHSPSVFL